MPFSWKDEDVSKLIDLWEKETCLYLVTHPNYHKKIKRAKAIANIRNKLICEGVLQVTDQDITKKIHGLRTQFLCETNKIKKSMANDDDDIYVPKLWTYPLLQFLQTNIYTARPSVPNLNHNKTQIEIVNVKSEMTFDDTTDEVNISDQSVRSTPSPTGTYSSKKRKIQYDETEEPVNEFFNKPETIVETPMNKEDDDIAKFTQLIQAEMRNVKNISLLRKLKRDIITLVYNMQETDENLK